MSFMDILVIVSLITGIASLILAVVAIIFARTAQKDSQDNFEKTQKLMVDFYDKTKDVLAEIDKRAAVTEKTVTDSHEKLLNTVTSLLNETILPQKQDMGEQMGAAFMQLMLQDPDKADKIMSRLAPFIEKGKKS